MMLITQTIMSSLRKEFAPDSISLLQNNGACMDVLHVHMHVIPRFTGDRFGLVEPDIHVTEDEMEDILAKLDSCIL